MFKLDWKWLFNTPNSPEAKPQRKNKIVTERMTLLVVYCRHRLPRTWNFEHHLRRLGTMDWVNVKLTVDLNSVVRDGRLSTGEPHGEAISNDSDDQSWEVVTELGKRSCPAGLRRVDACFQSFRNRLSRNAQRDCYLPFIRARSFTSAVYS